MIPAPSGVRVWLAAGRTDMRRGMNGLSLQVQETLGRDPFAGDLFVFRGAKGNLIKILWHDGIGLSLYAKRLERGRFVWPSAAPSSLASPRLLSLESPDRVKNCPCRPQNAPLLRPRVWTCCNHVWDGSVGSFVDVHILGRRGRFVRRTPLVLPLATIAVCLHSSAEGSPQSSVGQSVKPIAGRIAFYVC